YVDGLGLGHTVAAGPGPSLPARGAAEIVARVGGILLDTGATGLWHPGPEPTDVIVDAAGRVRVSGFVGPYPPSPSMRAPGPEGEAAQVYRLGALLAHLVSGVPPGPASEREGHRAMVRQVMIRAMSRTDATLTDRLG